jgi:hypothetical protein
VAPALIVGWIALTNLKGEEPTPQEAQFACRRGSLDGSMPDLVLAMKDSLHDPDSFEHVKTSATVPDKDGHQTVRMSYRAANAFGAKTLASAEATMKVEGCKVLEWHSL